MDSKRLLMGGVVGAIVMTVYGFLVWEMLLGGFFDSHMTMASPEREAPIMWAVVLSSFLASVLLTMILGWASTSGAAAGFKTGLLAGVLYGASIDFLFYAFMDMMDMTGTLVDIVLVAVMWGITGLVIALLPGGKGGAAEPAPSGMGM